MNKVIITGNLVKDIEIQPGSTVGKTTIVSRRSFKDKQTGQYESDFINVVIFGETLGYMQQFGVRKGTKVLLEGEWRSGNYEKQDGTKVYTNELAVNKFENLTPRDSQPQNYQTDNQGYHQPGKDGYQQATPPGQTYQQTYQEPVYNQQPQVNGQPIPQGLGQISDSDLPF